MDDDLPDRIRNLERQINELTRRVADVPEPRTPPDDEDG